MGTARVERMGTVKDKSRGHGQGRVSGRGQGHHTLGGSGKARGHRLRQGASPLVRARSRTGCTSARAWPRAGCAGAVMDPVHRAIRAGARVRPGAGRGRGRGSVQMRPGGERVWQGQRVCVVGAASRCGQAIGGHGRGWRTDAAGGSKRA